MTTLDGAHVLVFGATGGLGSAIARELADAAATLTLSARNVDGLQELASSLGDAVNGTVPADLIEPGAAEEVVTRADAITPLTGVVNAAGVVAFGPAAEIDDDTLDDLLLLNLIAPIRLVRASAATLSEGGFVVQISAVVAEKPTAGMATYSATKAGLTAFDNAAATELRRRKIRLIDARPTHTETGLADRPIAGTAPRLPQGLDPAVVARRIVAAIIDDERDLGSSAFSDAS